MAISIGVFRTGTRGTEMFFINRGSVSVMRPDGETAVASLGAGEFFGEIALLQGQPRMATITAVEDCEVYVLDQLGFDRALTNHPEFADEMRHVVEERLKQSTEESTDS